MKVTFSLFEKILWFMSILVILAVFMLFNNNQYLYLISSLIGVTALLFVSKGHPLGQLLTVLFSVFYGFIAYQYAYYGEMITYLGMTAPIALFALIAWLRNPYQGRLEEVEIQELSKKSYIYILVIGIIVTLCFYFILDYLNTPLLWMSTLSIFTSFVASVLTLKRSRFYGLAYAANDIILMVLWSFASTNDISYIALVICFLAFLIHDVYGYFNWTINFKKQKQFA